MLINAMIDNFLSVLNLIFMGIYIPDMPAEIASVIETVNNYTIDAMPIVWVFFDKGFTSVCLGLVLAVITFKKVYEFIMWVVTKIPALNIGR